MINNIEDAIKACKNEIILCGVLNELNIDFNDRGDSVVVKYKGVVTLCKNNQSHMSAINFYGSISNNSPMFESIITELKLLTAFIKTTSTNNEISEPQYSDKASIVYIRGSIISSQSIKAEYIACSKGANRKGVNYHNAEIRGIVTGINDLEKEITIFVIDSYYHRYITLPCTSNNIMVEPNTIEIFGVVLYDFVDSLEPFACYKIGVADEINEKVIQQAKLEHDIYENSLNV